MSPRSNHVVKSNKLIEASYRLNLLEQRIILYAIVQARESNTGLHPNRPCTFRIADFAKQFSITHTTLYGDVKEALNDLFKRQVTTYGIHEESGKPSVTHFRWLSSYTYSDQAGHLAFSFTSEVVPYITRLEENFTRYDLDQIAPLKSAYAVRFYELLKQNQAIGNRTIEVDWLRKHLDIENSYADFHELTRVVIDPALKQINANTDLKITYTKARTKGRAVDTLHFVIKTVTPKQPKQGRFNLPITKPEPGESKEAYEIRKRNLMDKPAKPRATPEPLEQGKPAPMPEATKELFEKILGKKAKP
jgi:plasmid replication initiation protein